MNEMRICAVVPTYDNPQTIRRVVERLRAHLPDVIVVNDGSGRDGTAAVDEVAREGLADVLHRARNGGKGAAVKVGLARAADRGFTHALQVDADGQHDLDDVPRFVKAARQQPEALVLGRPLFDESAPRSRQVGRRITSFWVRVETGRDVIGDAMCGFRVYPVQAALLAGARGDAMDFDPEVAVRLVWAGLPIINLPTRVRYLDAADGGVSHFRLFRDNVHISIMHARLTIRRVFAALFGALPGRSDRALPK